MIRLGLCCMFRDAPIRFRQTTATAMERRSRGERMRRLAALCMANADALYEAIGFCAARGIGAFRVNSQILPLRTHPTVGYAPSDLPGGTAIEARFRACGRLRRTTGVRLSFHPDQFVVLNSPRTEVVRSSIEELVYHAEVARWIGADAINIHGGGAYGLSSPRAGWVRHADWKPHHDFIDAADLPACWRGLDLTIDVEAKAKEAAVLRLKDDLHSLGIPTAPSGGTCSPDSGPTRATHRPGTSNRRTDRPALPRVTRGVRKVGP